MLSQAFQVIRAILGLVYLLFLPGFTASWALFPRKDEIDLIERVALSFGLSLLLSIVPVMILNYYPGIKVNTLNVFLIILTDTSICGILAVKKKAR